MRKPNVVYSTQFDQTLATLVLENDDLVRDEHITELVDKCRRVCDKYKKFPRIAVLTPKYRQADGISISQLSQLHMKKGEEIQIIIPGNSRISKQAALDIYNFIRRDYKK